MGDNWPVFLTASNVPSKTLNRAMLLLLDYEFSDDPLEDSPWFLLTSTDLSKSPLKATIPPLDPIKNNSFENKTVVEINEFVRTHELEFKQRVINNMEMSSHIWVVIDQEGLDHDTCIVVERPYDNDDDAEETSVDFKGVRVPYTVASDLTGNLSIANMGFEDWADEDAGVQADGLYKWVGPFPKAGQAEATIAAQEKGERETEAKTEATLKIFRELGHID